MSKRKDYISWDEYFMGVALLASQRSKDPSTQVGACIVNDDNRIMSVGYNGFPRGCSDDEFPWEREGETTHTKYPYVCLLPWQGVLMHLLSRFRCLIKRNSAGRLYQCLSHQKIKL